VPKRSQKRFAEAQARAFFAEEIVGAKSKGAKIRRSSVARREPTRDDLERSRS
jgi:hypothetical protein